jgi:hypothetical protein
MDELERFKSEIDLVAFAASRGYEIERRASSRGSVAMRHPTSDDKIIVSRAQRDRHWIYFSVRDSRDHGSIVDFVQHRGGGTLRDVRCELGAWIGAAAPAHPSRTPGRSVAPRAPDRSLVARAFAAARVVDSSAYLESRGIRPAILASARFAGTFRVDARGNVLFPHCDAHGLSGFESKNHGWTSFAAGGTRALWRSHAFDGDASLVLVESAIDAISFHQVHAEPSFCYASTAGAIGARQRGVIAETLAALPPGVTVTLAFDHDAAGERLADEVRLLRSRDVTRLYPPRGKDWNEYLQSTGLTLCRGVVAPRNRARER